MDAKIIHARTGYFNEVFFAVLCVAQKAHITCKILTDVDQETGLPKEFGEYMVFEPCTGHPERLLQLPSEVEALVERFMSSKFEDRGSVQSRLPEGW